MNEAPDKEVASMKSKPVAVNPSTVTTSFEVTPLIPPDPYWISASVPFDL